MALASQVRQASPEQGTGFQVEGRQGVPASQFPGCGQRIGGGAQVQPGEGRGQTGLDVLAQFPGHGQVTAAQSLMAVHQSLPGPGQPVAVQGTVQQQGLGHVIGRRRPLEAGQHPESALGMGGGVVVCLR